MKTNFKTKLYGLLKKDSRLWDEEKKELNETLLKDLIDKLDEKLIELLLSDKETKEMFFIKAKDVFVFKQNELKFFIDENKLDNSYTQYQNKIGLRIGNKLLSERDEVVLDWPFKDCVLEGGMTKEDQKRKEIFFNEVLAKDEIDRLFDPKALVNWKRYTAKGEEKVKELKRDKDGTIRENLIIKGNNLLALHSLKEQFTGKVKLIYIDPPYNTEGVDDSFKYNDSFNHSTWLVFMRNRLEVAKDLLSKDGAIYIQLDYNEVHYCKILMDEIFGRENFQREIIWRIGWISGYKSADKNWIRNHDTILFYSRDKNNLEFIKKYIPYSKDYVRRDGVKPEGQGYPYEDTWNCNEIDSLNSIAIISFSKEKVGDFKGQKNEALVQRIVEAHTKDGEIILDFFSGTGTTASVAQKLNRQWISLEQIDVQLNKQLNRLKKTLAGDQTGISKDVGWQGGGDFVYFELARWNEEAKEKILKAKNLTELEKLFDELYERYFLNYNVKTKEFKEKILKEEGFINLSLDKQKNLFVEMLDMNQMYVNFSERADKKYNLSEKDIKLSEEFYLGK